MGAPKATAWRDSREAVGSGGAVNSGGDRFPMITAW